MGPQLIADIGGTSSRWALVPEGGPAVLIDGLPGANPAVGDGQALVAELNERCAHDEPFRRPASLVIYGAGCGTEKRRERMESLLRQVWPKGSFTIDTDLAGAARSTCGDRPGLVLILGTGMNAGYYDGHTLHQRMPSLGFILGDEGSGADIGKHFLHEMLYGRVDGHLLERLLPKGVDLADVIERLYRSNGAQAFLASFTAGLAGAIDDPWVQDLVKGRFRELAQLLQRFFPETERAQIFATGSVAFGLKDELGPCLAERGMVLMAVQRDPLPGLVAYHRQHRR